MILTFLALPIYSMAVPLDGDYSDTEQVQYTRTVEVTVDVPMDNGWPRLPKMYTPMLERYVMPDDPAVRQVAGVLEEYGEKWDCSERRMAETVRKWVHSNIRYVQDSESHGWGDYWQTPYETLRLRTGDCEDMAVLFASICGALGMDAVLVSEPGHISAGVLVGQEEGDSTVSYGGRTYVAADATASAPLGGTEPDVSMVYPTHAGLAVHLIVLADALVIVLAAFLLRKVSA